MELRRSVCCVWMVADSIDGNTFLSSGGFDVVIGLVVRDAWILEHGSASQIVTAFETPGRSNARSAVRFRWKHLHSVVSKRRRRVSTRRSIFGERIIG